MLKPVPKLLVLAGLGAIEKMQLAVDLAQHWTDAGQSVTVIDNIARLRIDPVWLSTETLLRYDGDIVPMLPDFMAHITAAITLVALSENTAPDDLFVALDRLKEMRPNLAIHTVALLDLRTCDCFPALRETFEQYADAVLHAPFAVTDVLEVLR
jgi:hypothetical protein